MNSIPDHTQPEVEEPIKNFDKFKNFYRDELIVKVTLYLCDHYDMDLKTAKEAVDHYHLKEKIDERPEILAYRKEMRVSVPIIAALIKASFDNEGKIINPY